jgi:hypothetical protein
MQVVPNFFSQNQAETLDPEKSVLETLELAGSNKPISELKALLGRFMFQVLITRPLLSCPLHRIALPHPTTLATNQS